MCGVADLEAGPLTRQTARPERREAALVGQPRDRLASDLDRARAPAGDDAASGSRELKQHMAVDKRPGHLRPVPARASDEISDEPGSDGILGLTPPLGRGNSAMFLTDVIVELGYATRGRRRRGDPGGEDRRPLGRRAAGRAS